MKKFIAFILFNSIFLYGYGQVNNQDAVIIAEKPKKDVKFQSPGIKNKKVRRSSSVICFENINKKSTVRIGPKFKNKKHFVSENLGHESYTSSKKIFSTGPKSKKSRFSVR